MTPPRTAARTNTTSGHMHETACGLMTVCLHGYNIHVHSISPSLKAMMQGNVHPCGTWGPVLEPHTHSNS